MKWKVRYFLAVVAVALFSIGCEERNGGEGYFMKATEVSETIKEIETEQSLQLEQSTGMTDIVEASEASKEASWRKYDTCVTNLFEAEQASEEVAAYEAFLTGTCRAYCSNNLYDDGFYDDVLKKQVEKGFFLADILEGIEEDVRERIGGVGSVQYALIDCGNDGKKQLALRTYGMAFHYPDDDSDFTMVFDWQDKKVTLIYAVASWARNYDTLYADGYVSGYGSGGARYQWEGIIGADGIYHSCYHGTITPNGIHGMGLYTEFCKNNDIKVVPIDFYEYTIDDEMIYAYDILEETTDIEEQVINNYLAENEAVTGMHLLTNDVAWEYIENKRKTLGITDEMGEEKNKITWSTLFD